MFAIINLSVKLIKQKIIINKLQKTYIDWKIKWVTMEIEKDQDKKCYNEHIWLQRKEETTCIDLFSGYILSCVKRW